MKPEIDFSSPTHKLDEVLFKVDLQDVYSDFQFNSAQGRSRISTPNYKAVVNQSDGQIISIVSKNYQLISNEYAIALGKQLFTQLYPTVDANRLIPYKVVAPLSKASAYIDLIHEDVNFNVWNQDTWLPFLRTCNSYNRTVALSFEIGFVRKLCSNGVLFNKETLKLKYLHNKSSKIEVLTDASQIQEAAVLFTEQCSSLKSYEIPGEHMIALVCKILNINLNLPEDDRKDRKFNAIENLLHCMDFLADRYTKELGSNAYTAFNVATDLVSHQNDYKNLPGYNFNIRSFFAKPTIWMVYFTNSIKKNDFIYANYLNDTLKSLEKCRKNV